MTDYRHMYYILCDAVSKALDAMQERTDKQAREILQKALDEAEEMYIATSE